MVLWDQAKQIMNGKVSMVVVPIQHSLQESPSVLIYTDKDPASNKQRKRENVSAFEERLIIFDDEKGKRQMQLVQHVPDKDYLKRKAFKPEAKDFDGYVVYLDWEETPLRVQVVENGKVINSMVPLSRRGRQIATCNYTVVEWAESSCPCGDCYQCYTYILHREVVEFGCSGDGAGGGDGPGGIQGGTPAPPSGGGYGGGNETPSNNDNSYNPDNLIIARLTFTQPCLADRVKDWINVSSSSSLYSLLLNFAANNRTKNLTFKGVTNDQIPGAGGATAPDPNNSSSWIIGLNQDVLNNSSREFIYSIFVHELMHVQLALDDKDWQNHERFFDNDGQYIEVVRNQVKNLYPGLSNDDYIAFSLAGFPNTDELNNLARNRYGMTISQAQYRVEPYRLGSSGTKVCNLD